MPARLLAEQRYKAAVANQPGSAAVAVAVFGAVVVVLLALFGLRYVQLSAENEAQAEAMAIARGNSVATQIRDSLGATLRQASVTHELAGMVTQAHLRGDADVEARLLSYLDPASGKVGREVAQVSAVGADGMLLWTNLVNGPTGLDFNDRENVKAFRDHPDLPYYFGRPVIGRASGTLSVQSTHPVRAADGHLLAVTVLSLQANALMTLAAANTVRPDDMIAVVRDDGVILMRRDMQHLGESVPGWRGGSATGAGRSDIETKSGTATLGDDWFGGGARYYVTRNLADSGLTLVVGVLRAPELAQIERSNAPLGSSTLLLDAAIAVMAVAGGWAMYFFGRSTNASAYAASLEQSEIWFHSVMNGMAHGILVFDGLDDGDRRISFANRAAGEMFGLRAEALIGREFMSLIPNAAVAHAVRRTEAVLRGEALEPTTYEIVRPDGAPAWIRSEAVVSRIPGEMSRLRLITTLRDITDEYLRATALAEARERLDHILQIIPGVFYHAIAPAGEAAKIVYVSESVRVLFGLTPDYVMQGTFEQTHLPPEARARRAAAMVDAGADGVAMAEYTLQIHDREYWVRDVMRQLPLPDGGQEVIGFLADVTDEHAVDLARRAADANVAAMALVGPGLMYRALVRETSLEMLNIFGDVSRLTQDVVTVDGQPVSFEGIFVQQDRVAAMFDLPDDRTTSADYDVLVAGGGVRWLRNAVRVVGRKADAVEVVGYVFDVTMERQEQLRHQQLTTILTLGEMATGIAHELNQPLAVISFATENLLVNIQRDKADMAMVTTKLERILHQAHRAARLVQHMRVFARNEPMPVHPVSWAVMIEGAMEVLSAKLRGVLVSIDIPGDLPQVMGAEIPLEQVLVNLVSNAVDAYQSARPEAVPVVTICGYVQGDEVVVRVTDQAGGVPPHFLTRIFEPFFTTKSSGKGIGLGLALAVGTVTDIGGVLTVANEDDGAVFEIRLPAARAAVAIC